MHVTNRRALTSQTKCRQTRLAALNGCQAVLWQWHACCMEVSAALCLPLPSGIVHTLTRDSCHWTRLYHPHCGDATKLCCVHEGICASQAVAHEASRISIAERPHIVCCRLNILNTCNSKCCLSEDMCEIRLGSQAVLAATQPCCLTRSVSRNFFNTAAGTCNIQSDLS